MGKPVTGSSTKQTKQERRRDRREEQRKREEERQRAAKRNRIVWGVSILATVLVVAASIYFFAVKNPDASYFFAVKNPGASAAADQSSNPAYPKVDNIVCQANEQVAYHVHAHLSLYINGAKIDIPQNIGIASDQSCLYWLHTHDNTGVIHVEAPGQQTFTLGTFFKEWSEVFPQLQYPVQLSSTDGWKVYVNGKPYNGDFHKIELSAHTLITMAYQTPNAPVDAVYNWGDL